MKICCFPEPGNHNLYHSVQSYSVKISACKSTLQDLPFNKPSRTSTNCEYPPLNPSPGNLQKLCQTTVDFFFYHIDSIDLSFALSTLFFFPLWSCLSSTVKN